MEENTRTLSRDTAFGASFIGKLQRIAAEDRQFIAGPDLKFVCSPECFRPQSVHSVEIAIVEQDRMEALARQVNSPHSVTVRDVIAAVATVGDRIVGAAGVGADGETMWQIGVEVAPAYRGRGIGTALVSAATEQIFRKGKIPYYSTTVANLHSSGIALKLGYWLAWTEMVAKDE